MENRRTQIMPYIFVCGMGILNLLLMAMPFIQLEGNNISGYIIISSGGSAVGVIIGALQVIIMLLLFFMLIYGSIGILYSCGVSGVNMAKRSFRLFCAVPIILLVLLYLLQFVLIIIYSTTNSAAIGIGLYMSFFLNISITVVFTALLKTPVQTPAPKTTLISIDEDSKE